MTNKAIYFDLDDTILDTANLIIAPTDLLWLNLLSAEFGEKTVGDFGALLSFTRRAAPEAVLDLVELWFQSQAAQAVQLRTSIDQTQFLENLTPDCIDEKLLSTLSSKASLTLLTQGNMEFQSQKIARLNLQKLFNRIEVVDGVGNLTKYDILKKEGRSADNVWVIGNRLDNEIAAGAALGMRTIWVKQGEGSLLSLGFWGHSERHHVVDYIGDIVDLLK